MKTFSTQTATMNGTLSSNSQDINNLKTQVDTLTSNDEGMDQDIDDLKDEMNTLSNGLKGKADTFRVGEDQRIYIYSGDELLTAIGPFSGGTGGGGGSGEPTNTAEMTFTNTTGWITSTISASGTCNISFEWSSIQENTPTGDGSLTVYVNSVSRITRGIAQGSVSFDVSSYLIPGRNLIRLAVYDTYENVKYQNYTISVVDLQIRSSFDSSVPFTGEFLFPYTPVGAVEKTVHFLVDGEEIGTEITSVTGRQLSYTIPAQSYGSHSLTVYCDADVAGEIIKSNTLYYEFIFIDGSSTRTTITSSFAETSIKQYTTVNIPYRVYSPLSANVEVKLYVNGSLISTQTVNRDEQSYSYRAEEIGNIIFRIEANNTTKDIEFEVTSGDIDIKPETNDLVLYLTAQGRSNNENTRDVWKYEDTQATFSNFTWRLDGWQLDDDNISVMRVQDDARIIIPYKIFEQDFKGTGKTIEIEFATHSVVDYSAVIVNCMSGNIGFQITPQSVIFKGAQTSIQALYKDNEHVRVSIVVEKQIDNRLICVYINGIMSGAIQYASGERFSQLTPMNILIGSDDCGIDIYNIRVYDNNLNRMQIVDNWIADTQIGELMIQRYNHNDIYNPNMEITTETLPSNLPYFILDAEELPQYKGDKKKISLTYVDPIISSKSFTASGVEIDVQGTSSSIYYFKNFDLKFKQGFQTNNGTVDGYMLRNNSIPFNRFVLKADVASSESANNTVLSMFYSDSDPYKVPEQIEDPRVRQGIEGIPVAVFWHNTKTEEIKFHGKYNFNLPKRAAAPYGYDGDEESWEFERNNSANMKFQDDDFETQAWDEVNQKFYPEWYDDWQARFPSDEWRDISKLKEFVSWVKSTYRDAATNENLSNQVTYTLNSTITVDNYPDDKSYTVTDGTGGSKVITFTKDTPAYRLTKFKAEASKYMELDSAYYYYLYTLMFLMIDSRAKNMFIGFHGGEATELINEGSAIDRKVVFEPYDMDTAIGTNNSGVLMFPYHLLDIDTASAVISGSGSEAPVYNAQDSVLWCNIRDAFRAEYTAMYRNLRANRVWTYQGIEDLFENHQAKWPEAMYNEDAYEKYLVPLIDPVTKDETTGQLIRTDRYLTMLQGSKEQQRKWWLSNRFRYLDSMFSSGDAVNNTINLRLFNAGTLQITPAIDLFVGVSFGGGTTPAIARTTANHPASFSYSPKSGVTEMETWIYSADLITDVGDLSGFYPNEIDFSKATKLQNLKIGSGEQGYSNTNLRALNVQNCLLLENIDVRNCPNLAINVNLENSTRLKSALFEGSSITGVDLADGGVLETLHLPATVAQLTLLNLSKLSDLQVASYSNITRLMIANMNHLINPQTILGLVPANTEINIVGIDLTYDTYEEIDAFYDLLDTMKGITRQKNSAGEWMYHNFDKAQVSGVIRIQSLTGAQVADLEARYPELDVIANHTTSYRYYKNYDGTVDIGTVRCIDGVPESAAPAVPSRTSTTQYSYAPLGWDSDMDSYNSNYNHNAITKGDTVWYAAYTRTVRTYTITWVNNGTTIETDTNVPYGATPQYNGATPTKDGQTSTGWTPTPTTVTGNATYTATYLPSYSVKFYNGSTLLYTDTVIQGGTASYSGSTPVNSEDSSLAFIGWGASSSSTNADAVLTNIQSNKSVYAVFETGMPKAPTATTADGAYGVEWDYSQSSPQLTRKGLAASFADPVPATSVSGTGSSPFDNIQPWAGMKEVNILSDGTIIEKSDPRFSYTDNDVMVWIPEFYYTAYKDETNQKWLWAISPTAKTGFEKHPGSGRYISKYFASDVSDEMVSRFGTDPLVGTSSGPITARSKCSQKGNNWYMLDIATWSALQMLYLIEFANFDSQTTLGISGTIAYINESYHTVKATKTSDENVYRHIIFPISGKTIFIDGLQASQQGIFIGIDNASFDNKYSALFKVGNLKLPSRGYISGFGYNEISSWAFLPDMSSGTESTFVCDRVFSNANTRFPLSSGGSTSGYSNFGFFFFSAVSNSGTNDDGIRLIYIPSTN